MKKNLVPLVWIGVVMVGLPWAAVAFAPGDAGLVICFLLFYGVNPLCSLFVGGYAGQAASRRWYLPGMNAAAFLLSAWSLFDMGERAFLVYAAIYLAMGMLAMAGAFLITKIRKN